MSFCERAIAYLRVALPDDDPSEALELAEDDSPVLKELGGSWLVAYLVDEGDRFTYVQRHHLREEKRTADQLHAVGLANLKAMSENRLEVRSAAGTFAALMGGNFEASLLLLDDLWETKLRGTVTHDFVACAPARDVLAYCDSESPEGLAELRRIVERIWPDGDHLLSRSLFRRRKGRWEVLS